MVRTISEAQNLWCPFVDNSISNQTCMHKNCMAWQFDITDELDLDKTNKYASEEEIESGIYSNPIFKVSTIRGWCKLIDKAY